MVFRESGFQGFRLVVNSLQRNALQAARNRV